MDDEGAVAPVATAAVAALAVGSAAVDGAAKLSNSGIPVENMMMDCTIYADKSELADFSAPRARCEL